MKVAQKAGKPVVVSMGGVAASGGYYISVPAQVIVAQPGTLTGSIGIFAYKIDVSTLAEKLGINNESTIRGARAADQDQRGGERPDSRKLPQRFESLVGRHGPE